MEFEELKRAVSEADAALNRVTRAFENRLKSLQATGGDPEMIKQTNEAVNSMRDSAAIFIAWAYHYVGVSQEDETTHLSE